MWVSMTRPVVWTSGPPDFIQKLFTAKGAAFLADEEGQQLKLCGRQFHHASGPAQLAAGQVHFGVAKAIDFLLAGSGPTQQSLAARPDLVRLEAREGEFRPDCPEN